MDECRPGANRRRWWATVCAAGLLWAAAPAAQQAPAAPGAPPAQTPPGGLTFASGTGVVIFTVTLEGAGDFEAFFAKLKEALAQGAQPEYGEMAAGWTLYKVTDVAQAGQVLYASIINPVVPNADYDPVKIVSAAFPEDAAVLLPKVKAAVLSVNRMSLQTTLKLGQ